MGLNKSKAQKEEDCEVSIGYFFFYLYAINLWREISVVFSGCNKVRYAISVFYVYMWLVMWLVMWL